MKEVNKPEPAPDATKTGSAIWDLVIADMKERDESGSKKYGTRLRAFNGRNALIDAYQEALDLAVYIRQEIEERDTKSAAQATFEFIKIHPGSSQALTLDDYQRRARSTAQYPDPVEHTFPNVNFPLEVTRGLMYVALKLSGEAGEFSEKVGKRLRDHGGKLDPEAIDALSKELGDVLWYVANAAIELKRTLGEVAEANLAKLASRKERGVITGSGDNR